MEKEMAKAAAHRLQEERFRVVDEMETVLHEIGRLKGKLENLKVSHQDLSTISNSLLRGKTTLRIRGTLCGCCEDGNAILKETRDAIAAAGLNLDYDDNDEDAPSILISLS